MAVHLQQGCLGLPDRDFYFNAEAGVAKIRNEYVQHMLVLAGENDATAMKSAVDIIVFETALTKVSPRLEDLRDPQKNYNR